MDKRCIRDFVAFAGTVKDMLRKNIEAGKVPAAEEAQRFAKAQEFLIGLMSPEEAAVFRKETKGLSRKAKA